MSINDDADNPWEYREFSKEEEERAWDNYMEELERKSSKRRWNRQLPVQPKQPEAKATNPIKSETPYERMFNEQQKKKDEQANLVFGCVVVLVIAVLLITAIIQRLSH